MDVKNVLKGLMSRKKSLEKVDVDELRREKIALEQQEVKFHRQIEQLERQKSEVFTKGTQEASDRAQLILARKIKDLDAQARNLDMNCSFINRQLRILNGFVQLKENQNLINNYGLSSVITKMDLSKLQTYIERATVDRQFSMDRFAEILGRLEESEGLVGDTEEDQDIREIVGAMRAAREAETGDPESVVERGMQTVDEILHREKEAGEI